MVEVKSSDTLFMGHFNFKPITPSETLDPWGFFYLKVLRNPKTLKKNMAKTKLVFLGTERSETHQS